MSDNFQLVRGVVVPDLTGIHEAYSISVAPRGHSVFTVNVSAERIDAVFRQLVCEVAEPGFLVLEVGTHASVEVTLRKSEADPFHKDVFYLDGLTHQRLGDILDRHGDLLIQDGGIHFGFGSRHGVDEVFVGPYKIVYVYADAPQKFAAALDTLEYPREPRIRTVWSNFTRDAPGSRRVLTDVPTTIWDVIEELKGEGLYFAERRDA